MLEHLAVVLTDWVGRWGYLGIFAIMFAENLGLPVPSEIGFIVGQSMVVAGRSSYLDIFLVILVGKTAGSIVTYFAGRYFADRIKFLGKSNRLQQSQKVFRSWLKKYGSFAVFISRLIGYIRPWSSYLAGIGEIPVLPFIFYNVTGSAVIIIATMFVLGGAVEIWRAYPLLRPLSVAVFIILFAGFWIGLMIYNKYRKKNSL